MFTLLFAWQAHAAAAGRTTRVPPGRAAASRTTQPSRLRAAKPANKRTATATPARRRSSVFQALESDRLGLLVRIARSDPFLRAAMDAVLKDGARLISNSGKAGVDRGRQAWIPLVSNRPLRRTVVRTILRDMNSRSTRVKDLIRADAAPVWDTVFVGAGVHTAAAASALGQADRAHSMLVIEAGELVSANFASIGQTISINSSNRQETGEGVQPFGRGNNNPAEGPVGVPDLSGDKWPAADTLSDVATVSLHTSGADVITRSKVSRVSERGAGDTWPARYKIETSDGLTVYAASVVVGSGLGRPVIKVKRGSKLIASETSKVDLRRPDDVPGILYYSQAMALANQSAAPRDPYRAAPGGGRPPRIAVIGGGDSGKTFLELMYGLAPSDAYDGPGKLDRAQRGEIGALDWVVGPNGPTDCKSFLDGVRARYARISPSIKSGKAELVNRNFIGVEKKGDRFRVLYSDGTSRIYDKVIIATGFESEAPEVLQPILPAGYDTSVPFPKSNEVEKVFTQVGGGLRKPRAVAKRVIGQDVYFIGPASGDDLVDRNQILVKTDRSKKGAAPEPQIAISENLASIKFLVPYSAALARNVLPGQKAKVPTLDTGAADERLRTALVTTRGKRSQGRRIRRARVSEADDPASDPARTGLEPVVLKHEMATVLDEFTFGRLRSFELTVNPEPGGLLLEAPQLGESSITSLRDAVERNYALVQMLSKFARVGKSVGFRVNIARDGTIDVDSLTTTY